MLVLDLNISAVSYDALFIHADLNIIVDLHQYILFFNLCHYSIDATYSHDLVTFLK